MRCYKIDMKGLLQIIYTFVRYLRNILVQEDETLSYIFAHPQSYHTLYPKTLTTK